MTTLSTAKNRRRGEGEAKQSRSDLHEGVLHTIVTCLCSLVDLMSFKSVCRSWRAVGSSLSSSVITSHFVPLLLIPKVSNCYTLSGFGVFDPTSPSVSASLSLNLDKLKSLGLFTGHEFYTPVILENDGLWGLFRHSWMLTAPVSSLGSGILLFTRRQLLYRRIGSASWSCHLLRSELQGDVAIVTVRGTVYAMDLHNYNLSVLEFSPELHLRPLAVEGFKGDSFFHRHFLVNCGGEHLHVRFLYRSQHDGPHFRFEVFRLDSSVNQPRWVKMETLGNWAIFVGCDFHLPGIAIENRERWGGRSNCVYFHNAHENRDSPLAVLKLGDEIDMADPESPMYCISTYIGRLSPEWIYPGF